MISSSRSRSATHLETGVRPRIQGEGFFSSKIEFLTKLPKIPIYLLVLCAVVKYTESFSKIWWIWISKKFWVVDRYPVPLWSLVKSTTRINWLDTWPWGGCASSNRCRTLSRFVSLCSPAGDAYNWKIVAKSFVCFFLIMKRYWCYENHFARACLIFCQIFVHIQRAGWVTWEWGKKKIFGIMMTFH